MTVKELITALLDCNMEDDVSVKTMNRDKNGHQHLYYTLGVDSTRFYNSITQQHEVTLLFHNYDFDKED